MTGRGRAPVIGLSDRMIAVTSASRNIATAFKLLSWLASAEVSSQLVQAGDGQWPVRKSLAGSSSWYKDEKSAKQSAFNAQILESSLTQSAKHFVVPRIPGVDEYMAALNKAVTDAFDKGGVAPPIALEKAAKQWEEITDAHGRDAQRRAYLKHLQISE
jgi:ABC-type glycerol-3-phosphate transport system substrate-binding protein